jgi:hypothetical protein
MTEKEIADELDALAAETFPCLESRQSAYGQFRPLRRTGHNFPRGSEEEVGLRTARLRLRF